jgi:hypothetical protein
MAAARPDRRLGRPLFMEPNKKSLHPIALGAALPRQERRRAEQRCTDEPVDRAVDHQVEQRVDIAIEHTGDDVGHAFGDGIAEQNFDFLKGTTQQAQERLATFAVARCAQGMKPAEQQQAFIVRQHLAMRSPFQTKRSIGADSSIHGRC